MILPVFHQERAQSFFAFRDCILYQLEAVDDAILQRVAISCKQFCWNEAFRVAIFDDGRLKDAQNGLLFLSSTVHAIDFLPESSELRLFIVKLSLLPVNEFLDQ